MRTSHEPRTTNHEPRATSHERRRVRGVTLVEMVVVIAITGIIAAALAIFIRAPVEGYVDAARRAELTDIADTALRRITRDLRTALPNSIRVDGTGKYIEFLETRGGGRFRVDVDSGGSGDPLDFTAADDAFDVIGPMPTLATGDSIVIYNLVSEASITTTNAYGGDNRASVDVATSSSTKVTLTATKLFPFASPGRRFQVVKYPVTYACESGVLRRYWNYGISLAQPVPPVGGSTTLLATNVNDSLCDFSYSTNGANGRTGVVSLRLQVEESGEKVRLFQQVHVSNVP